jgi:hypothetical protein
MLFHTNLDLLLLKRVYFVQENVTYISCPILKVQIVFHLDLMEYHDYLRKLKKLVHTYTTYCI